MQSKRNFFMIIFFIFNLLLFFSSDRSDATDMMNKCDRESKMLEIPVKNFGDKNDLAKFNQGLGIIKQGKIKLAQSKFLDAKARFEEYLKLQYDLYASVGAKYIQRTEQLIDKIGEYLGEYISQESVMKNFNGASAYLQNAKSLMATKHYDSVIQPCRIAKNNLITIYTLVNMKIPEEYQRDIADYNNTIYNGK